MQNLLKRIELVVLTCLIICGTNPGVSGAETGISSDQTPKKTETEGSGAAVPKEDAKARVLTLDECIKKALAVGPSLEAAEYDRRVSEAKLSEAKGAYVLPHFKARVVGGVVPDVPPNAGPADGFPEVPLSISEMGPFVQVRIEAVQPLFTFGKLLNAKRAAQGGVRAKKAGERSARNELIHQVKLVYYGLVFLYSVENFFGELTDRAQKARDKVEELIKKNSPEVTDIDLMRLDVFQAETSRRLIQVENGIELGLETLKILVGIPQKEKVTIKDHMVTFREKDYPGIDYFLSRASVARPEMRQLDELVAIRKALLRVNYADYYPQFFLGGFYKFAEAPGRLEIKNPFLTDEFNQNILGGAVGFQQDLSFHLTHARHQQAKAEYLKAIADQSQARRGMEIQIRKAFNDTMSKKEGVHAARKGFKAGRSWVTATTLNFGIGLVPIKDLLEAFVVYTQVKVSYLETIHSYDKAVATLSKVVGEEVLDLKYE